MFEKHEQDDAVSYSIDNKKVDQKLRYKGYRVLVSDEISDAGKAWCAYQERWIVEDTFKTLKSRLGCSRNRVSDNESLTIGKAVFFLHSSLYFLSLVLTIIAIEVAKNCTNVFLLMTETAEFWTP